MATATSLCVRRMARRELDLVLDWAAAEGWNPGLFDAAPFYAADPDGFFLAEIDGEPVGSFSAVAYDGDVGFAGLLIVRPAYRGGRVGIALGRAGLEYLGSRTVGLDGVMPRLADYQRLGFQTAYRTLRYEFSVGADDWRATDTPARLVDLRQLAIDDIAAYDAECFLAPRPRFLEAWIHQPGTVALGVLQMDRLVGYGVIRPCRVGHKIGPLMADEPCVAELLFRALAATSPDAVVYLDVPEPNAAATALAHRHAMRPVFDTARMYKGPMPKIDLGRLYAVTTLELG